MKSAFVSIVISLALASVSFGQGYEEYLTRAKQAYEAGDKEAARELYLKAAENGSAEAHFALSYQYSLPAQESLHHYVEAAGKGHEKALAQALDAMLFRADSLRTANPQQALDLYHKAKKANPSLHLLDEDRMVNVMKMCAEPRGFDVEQFMAKYGVDDGEMGFPFYRVWHLAEEASREGRFGKPDPELVFNLVIRGGWVPAEFESAVEETYANWKNGVVKEFKICDYVTSGMGQAYCASLDEEEDETERDARFETIKGKLGGELEGLLIDAYDSAVKFIEARAENEEGHGGTARAATVLESQMRQKNQYLDLVEQVIGGFRPSPKDPLDKSDQSLNKTYQEMMKKAKKKADAANSRGAPTPEEIKQVQRLWIKYRDDSTRLFVRMSPSVQENVWKSWLTEMRTEQLKSMPAFEEE